MQAKQTITLQIPVSISAKSASLQVFPIIVYGIIIYSFDWVKIVGVPFNHQAHCYLWALHLMVPLLRMLLPSPDPHIILPFYLSPSPFTSHLFSSLFPPFLPLPTTLPPPFFPSSSPPSPFYSPLPFPFSFIPSPPNFPSPLSICLPVLVINPLKNYINFFKTNSFFIAKFLVKSFH